MLLRDSGRPDAIDEAVAKFEIARHETPNDPTLLHALASLYDRRGVYRKVIELWGRATEDVAQATETFLSLADVEPDNFTAAMLDQMSQRRSEAKKS